jgi:hypothetical protein
MQGQGDISVEFSAYLDGQLTPEAARLVDRAAAESPDVARGLHDLRRVRSMLRAIKPVSPAPDFVARVLAEARRRGLMRRVVRQRMLQGVVRLASAAAAVMLVAVVAGVAVQGLMNRSGPSGPQGTRAGAGEAAPAGAAGAASPNGEVRGLASLGGRARTLNLAVTDLGAAAKEVTAVLAEAGITRFPAGSLEFDSAGRAGAREPAPKPTMPRSKVGPDDLTGFSTIPGESDELRFLVMAPPDRIDAVTRRLDSLRQRESLDESSSGLCIEGLPRPAAVLPKAATTRQAGTTANATNSPGESYHAAEIQRLPNASQIEAGQGQAARGAASQAAGQAGPPNEAIIITVRLRPSDTSRDNPARNVKQ